MFDRVKASLKKTKEFVVEHQTFVLCAVTCLATAELVHGIDTRIAAKWAYEKGHDAGHLHVALDEAYTFIRERGLEPEFAEFTIPMA